MRNVVLSLTILLLTVSPAAAGLVVVDSGTGFSDTDFADNGFTFRWFAKGRNIASTPNTFELNVGTNPNDSSAFDQADFDWGSSGTTHQFELSYDAALETASWTVSSVDPVFWVPGRFTDIYIQLKGRPGDEVLITLEDLEFDSGSGFVSVSGSDFDAGDGAVSDKTWIRLRDDGLLLSDVSWTLAGELTVTWAGSPPTGDLTAIDIKMVDDAAFVPVPEPSTVLLFGFAAVGFLRRRLSRRY